MAANMDPRVSKSYSFDVVIIGAGIIGLSTAKHFLLHSELSVAVVDASGPCAGATGAAQGSLWMIHRTPGTATWDLTLRSLQLWKMLADNLQSQGVDPCKELGWQRTGSLLLGKTREEAEQLRKRAEQLCETGLKTEFLSCRELLLEEPELINLGPEGCAAFLPDDARIDVDETVAFIRKCNGKFTSEDRYVEFFDEPAVSLLRSSADSKVEAVITSNNILYAKKAIVVAAGCWTGSLMHKFTAGTDVIVDIPVQPRQGYTLILENFHEFLKLNHGVMEAGYANYQKTSTELSKPDDDLDHSLSISMGATLDAKGNLLVGTSRQFVGFNTELDMDVVRQMWVHAREFFPALRDLSLEKLCKQCKHRIGLRPYMPEGKPVIGPIPAMPNVFVATGHEGSGLLQALGTAELIADMVLANPLKVDPTPFKVGSQS